MIYLILIALLLLAIYGPNLWVQHVLKKHHRPLPGMPGSGSELAQHLLKQYQLNDVAVEKSNPNEDHYSPADNAVRLSPEVFDCKSLSAIAVAAHEVGHAIQFNRQEPVSLLRGKYLGSAHRVQRIGVVLVMFLPLLSAFIGGPRLAMLTIAVGVMTMLISVMMYTAVLPEEWDASFNKALPILEKGGYVPAEYLPAVKQVLTACALTYVAAALADILKLWRWLRLLR